MQIFFSYGHDKHRSVVEMLKKTIEELSMGEISVWMDTHEIPRDSHWRAKIVDGINSSSNVFAFLSEYSTRKDSVCRDELSISLVSKHGLVRSILLERADTFIIPALLSEYQWSDMSNYPLEMEKGEDAFKEYIEKEAKKIIAFIKSDEIQLYSKEIEQVRKILGFSKTESLTKFDILLEKELIGRDWLFDKVQNWIINEHSKNILMIYGKPGYGKSMFASQLQLRCPNIIAAFPCDCRSAEYSNVDSIVRNISYRLSLRLPDYRKWILNLDIAHISGIDLFDSLITQPLSKILIDGHRAPMVIVIDALDEMENEELAKFISIKADILKKYFKFIITSRKEKDIIRRFNNYDYIDLDKETHFGKEDLRSYFIKNLQSELKYLMNWNELLENMVQASDLVFAYAECIKGNILFEIQNGNYNLENIPFPHGLNELYEKTFDLKFGRNESEHSYEDWRMALGIILVSPEPIPISTFKYLLEWNDKDYNTFMNKMSSFFMIVNECIQVFHVSFKEWMQEKAENKYLITYRDGVEYLADALYKVYKHDIDVMDKYMLLYLTQSLRLVENPKYKGLYAEIIHNKEFLRRIFIFGDKLYDEFLYKESLLYFNELYYIYHSKINNNDMSALNDISEIAEVANRIGIIYEALNQFEFALKYHIVAAELEKKLVKDYPQNTLYMISYVKTLKTVGKIYKLKGHLSKSMEYYKETVRISKKNTINDPYNIQYQLAYSDSLQNVCAIYKMQNRLKKAKKYCKRNLKITSNLVKESPKNLYYQMAYGVAIADIAQLYVIRGNLNKAFVYCIKNLKISEKLIVQYPDDYEVLASYATVLREVGIIYLMKNDLDNALVYCAKDMDMCKKIAQKEGNTIENIDHLIPAMNAVGHIYKRLNRLEEAVKLYKESVTLSQKLVEYNPQNFEFQHVLQEGLKNVGEIYFKQGLQGEAIDYYIRSLDINQRHASENPENSVYQLDYINSLIDIGDIYIQQTKAEAAYQYYEEALKIIKKLAKESPEYIEYNVLFGHVLCGFARICKIQKKINAALSYYTDALKIYQMISKDNPEYLWYCDYTKKQIEIWSNYLKE